MDNLSQFYIEVKQGDLVCRVGKLKIKINKKTSKEYLSLVRDSFKDSDFDGRNVIVPSDVYDKNKKYLRTDMKTLTLKSTIKHLAKDLKEKQFSSIEEIKRFMNKYYHIFYIVEEQKIIDKE